jgi:D-arabinose 1-dehydrogenase-like Zn-dependent alcohol dehydrogenase
MYEGPSNGSKKLMRGVWRDGTFAGFAKVLLENCIPLDESRLYGQLGYSVHNLMSAAYLLVPYRGIRDIHLKPSETIIIYPATGFYSSLGVQIAVTIGARVIAIGRSEEKPVKLVEDIKKRLPGANIKAVNITGNEDKDTSTLQAFSVIDAVLDITPTDASRSSHTKSAIKSLRRGGRVSLIGSTKTFAVPEIIVNNNTLKGTEYSITLLIVSALLLISRSKGRIIHERESILQFVKILERGSFPSRRGLNRDQSFLFR